MAGAFHFFLRFFFPLPVSLPARRFPDVDEVVRSITTNLLRWALMFDDIDRNIELHRRNSLRLVSAAKG